MQTDVWQLLLIIFLIVLHVFIWDKGVDSDFFYSSCRSLPAQDIFINLSLLLARNLLQLVCREALNILLHIADI